MRDLLGGVTRSHLVLAWRFGFCFPGASAVVLIYRWLAGIGTRAEDGSVGPAAEGSAVNQQVRPLSVLLYLLRWVAV